MENQARGPRTFLDLQLDWVAVLGREHASELFRRLHEIVQRDVESAKKHAAARSGLDWVRFTYESDGEQCLSVTADWGPASRDPQQTGRYFELERNRIVVRAGGYDEIVHTAKAALFPPQHCLLDVEGHEGPMRLWQFSRLALEPLFFPEVDS